MPPDVFDMKRGWKNAYDVTWAESHKCMAYKDVGVELGMRGLERAVKFLRNFTHIF